MPPADAKEAMAQTRINANIIVHASGFEESEISRVLSPASDVLVTDQFCNLLEQLACQDF